MNGEKTAYKFAWKKIEQYMAILLFSGLLAFMALGIAQQIDYKKELSEENAKFIREIREQMVDIRLTNQLTKEKVYDKLEALKQLVYDNR